LRGTYRQHLPDPGIGPFPVRFRWFIVAAWLVAAGLIPRFHAVRHVQHTRAGPRRADQRPADRGAIPIAVDQQKQTGNTGNQIQGLSVVFIIILLLLIFRAALAPLTTLVPAFIAITIAGPPFSAATVIAALLSLLPALLATRGILRSSWSPGWSSSASWPWSRSGTRAPAPAAR
jgi:uncharacterized membrane protein YdfJ with MMPL/SSD domain